MDRLHERAYLLTQLLEVSLPILAALQSASERALVDARVPDVEPRTVTWYRVRFARHAIDVRLLRHTRVLVSDAAVARSSRTTRRKSSGDPISAFEPLPSLADSWPAKAGKLDDHNLLVHGSDAAKHLPALILHIAKLV